MMQFWNACTICVKCMKSIKNIRQVDLEKISGPGAWILIDWILLLLEDPVDEMDNN